MRQRRTDTRRIDQRNPRLQKRRRVQKLHPRHAITIIGIALLCHIVDDEFGQLGIIAKIKAFNRRGLKENCGAPLTAPVDDRRNRRHRHGAGRQQFHPQQRVDQRTFTAFELSQHSQVKFFLDQAGLQLCELGMVFDKIRPQPLCQISRLLDPLQQIRFFVRLSCHCRRRLHVRPPCSHILQK